MYRIYIEKEKRIGKENVKNNPLMLLRGPNSNLTGADRLSRGTYSILTEPRKKQPAVFLDETKIVR